MWRFWKIIAFFHRGRGILISLEVFHVVSLPSLRIRFYAYLNKYFNVYDHIIGLVCSFGIMENVILLMVVFLMLFLSRIDFIMVSTVYDFCHKLLMCFNFLLSFVIYFSFLFQLLLNLLYLVGCTFQDLVYW